MVWPHLYFSELEAQHIMTSIISSSWFKFSVVAASITGIMMLSGCAKKEAQDLTTLNIGFQKYGLLPIVKERGELDKILKKKELRSSGLNSPLAHSYLRV